MLRHHALFSALFLLGGCSGGEHPAGSGGSDNSAGPGGLGAGGAAAGASGAGGSIAGGAKSQAGGGAGSDLGGASTGGGGGGANNIAGNAGSGGAKTIPPVGKCDALPAAGMWQDVTPPGKSTKPAVNGTVGAAIIVDPLDPRTVWLGTGGENDEIWRSDDCGATWTQVNTGPGSIGDGKTFGGVGDGAQWSMQADPVDAGVLYAVSGYGAQSLWKTTDGGHSWKDILAGSEWESHADYRFVNNVSLDPTDHLHLVVSTHGSCSAPYAPSCIAETKDGGTSWRVLSAPEGWFEGGGLVLVKGGLWIWCGSTMKVTSNAGESWDAPLAGGGSCEAEYTIRPFVAAANGKYYLGSRNGVLTSSDGAKWSHIPNTNGNMVMVTQGSQRVFVADQWKPSIWSAKLDNDGTWTDLPAPAQISKGSDGGIPFLAYDDAHGVLYASMFSGGVARMVVP